MRATLFGDGAKGMRLQVHENEKYGVACTAVLPERGKKWTQTWMSDRTGEDEFESYAELRTAYNS